MVILVRLLIHEHNWGCRGSDVLYRTLRNRKHFRLFLPEHKMQKIVTEYGTDCQLQSLTLLMEWHTWRPTIRQWTAIGCHIIWIDMSKLRGAGEPPWLANIHIWTVRRGGRRNRGGGKESLLRNRWVEFSSSFPLSPRAAGQLLAVTQRNSLVALVNLPFRITADCSRRQCGGPHWVASQWHTIPYIVHNVGNRVPF